MNPQNEQQNQDMNVDTAAAQPNEGEMQAPVVVDAEKLYKDLDDCLESLIKVYRSVLEIVRKEKEILVGSRLDELTENNKSKDALLVRIRSLENHRLHCARDLAASVGADVEQPRLLDIANHCDKKWQDRLRMLHSVLELLVRRVAEVNKQNEGLVQAALTNITGAMEAIRDGLKPKPVYGRQGEKAQGKADGGQLVSREA